MAVGIVAPVSSVSADVDSVAHDEDRLWRCEWAAATTSIRWGRGRTLILGGMEVPHSKGLLGHSDADALVHALCDALLGAMGEGDFGRHYPSSDQRFKDISSLKLLEDVVGKMREQGVSHRERRYGHYRAGSSTQFVLGSHAEADGTGARGRS